MMIGAHCSISGGLEKACEEAEKLNMDCIQIFTKNQRQWRERAVTNEEADRFRKSMQKAGIKKAFSHTTYLINLAAQDEEIRKKSIISLAAELIRCDALGLSYTVLHPGSNKYVSEEEAIQKIAEGLKVVIQHTAGLKSMVLLENTAGQGAFIGRSFAQIKKIMNLANEERLGMCFDTCHAFAAGYDIRTFQGCEATFNEIEQTVGLRNLKAFHLNDSKGALGSNLDRHENIGQGQIGTEAFKYIMQHFPDHPKVIETPKKEEMDAVNLSLLRKMA
ncbi:deoxyribonuclease IV [Cytophagaceae bacterium ABcell3]|nr:deoxyribonuclease IV [Cytophagaceae bacterium ABcell3]